MIVKNAQVYCESGEFENSDVLIDAEFFTDKLSDGTDNSTDIIDATGCYAIPGLIDIHIHGCAGSDFSSANTEKCCEMTRFQAQNGITSIYPTTLTLPKEHIANACRNIVAASDPTGAYIAGIHLEGPFFSYNKRGAQNPEYLKLPDADMLRFFQKESGGLVKLVSIAPELKGAIEVINELSSDIRFSIGHTEADYNTTVRAINAGARQVTHLWCCTPQISRTEPGVTGAVRDNHECSVEIICDGVHVHPGTVRTTFAMFGDDRIIMVSDSIMATGMNDGIYDLGGLEVEVTGRDARLTSTKKTAGSVTTLAGCLKTVVNEMDIPLCSAVKCCTANPAKAMGIYDKRGSITKGKYADLILLDRNLTVKNVILRGTLLK